MKPFKEFQFCWWMFIVILPIMAAMNYGVFNDPARSFGDHHIVFNITCLLILLLFYSMTTIVKEDKIVIYFGIGLIHKTIRIDHLKNIDVVYNSIVYGWGIHSIPNGWLYNISGSHGIELQFSNRERIVRIGSKNSELLRKEVLLHKVSNG